MGSRPRFRVDSAACATAAVPDAPPLAAFDCEEEADLPQLSGMRTIMTVKSRAMAESPRSLVRSSCLPAPASVDGSSSEGSVDMVAVAWESDRVASAPEALVASTGEGMSESPRL